MNNISVYLSSIQTPGIPNFLDHYIFVDPIEGSNITYPNTANGGFFTGTTYFSAVSGGPFYPWGYIVQNTYTNINLGVLKGPYTLTFVPSSIDTTYYTVLKIIYDFGDGSNIVNIEKDIVVDYTNIDLAGLINGSEIGNPKFVYVSHDYWPKQQSTTTYTAIVTVVNGNFVNNIFNISFSSIHDSLYDYNDFHLINKLDLDSQASKNLVILEADKETSQITNLNLKRSA